MNTKKEIHTLLKYISEGDYNKAKRNVKHIIETKISGKIKQISNSKTKRA